VNAEVHDDQASCGSVTGASRFLISLVGLAGQVGLDVWRGVCGLVYARRPRISSPFVVRGEDAVDLRDQIRRAESKLTYG
jgi:hypothetical protein